jgi:hypothetical protein
MVERKYFTQEEAQAKVGRRIRTRVAWSGVPEGTTGAVIRADPIGRIKPPMGEAMEVFDVAIQWDLPREPLQMGRGQVEGEPVLVITGGGPSIDWFTKDEYEEYLEELESRE